MGLSRVRRALVVSSTALALGSTARDAAACVCSWDGAVVYAPEFAGEPVDLRDELVDVRCDREGRTFVVCRFKAWYQLHNPGASRMIAFAVGHPAGAAVTITLDGAVVVQTAAPGRAERRRAAERQAEAATLGVWSAPAGGDAELVVEAEFLIAGQDCGCVRVTDARRHPWVTRRPGRTYDVEYVRAGAKFRTGPPEWSASHDIPASWRGDFPRWGGAYVRTKRRKSAAYIWHDMSTADAAAADTAAADGAPTDAVSTAGRSDRGTHWGVGAYRRWQFTPGGPIAAAGLGWSPEGVRARVRAGWEVAWPPLVVHSLVVETDARRRVAVVPAWELTWPMKHFLVPDLGVGLGVPIQVVPAARTGVRLHWRFGYWIFHLIGTFDHFPGGHGLPRERLGSLLLQVGF